jgi:hypothetical protein
MQKSFICFLCFYAVRHAIRRFCLIWSYICNKVQKDAKRCEKTQKLKCSFPDERHMMVAMINGLERANINFTYVTVHVLLMIRFGYNRILLSICSLEL